MRIIKSNETHYNKRICMRCMLLHAGESQLSQISHSTSVLARQARA